MICPHCKMGFPSEVNYDLCPHCHKVLNPESQAKIDKAVKKFSDGMDATLGKGNWDIKTNGSAPAPAPDPKSQPTGENEGKNGFSVGVSEQKPNANGDLFPPATPVVAVVTGEEVDDAPTREDLKEELLRLRRRIRKVKKDESAMKSGFKGTLKGLEENCDAIIDKLDDLDGVEVEDANLDEED